MEEKNFHLGLCLAGAVSAGAYTAGVIDYLIEALDKWQKRKNENLPDTPSHNVVIRYWRCISGWHDSYHNCRDFK